MRNSFLHVPVAYQVYCHSGEYDYRLFAEMHEAEDFAEEQIEESGKSSWAIYPLIAANPVDFSND